MKFVLTLGYTKRFEGAYSFLKRNLELGGHEVIVTPYMDEPEKWGKADAQFYVDFAQDCFPHLAEAKVALPSLIWQSDTHLGGFDYRLEQSRKYDHVWVAQKSAAQMFREMGIPQAEWMPHCADHNLWCPPLRKGGLTWSDMAEPPDIEKWEQMTCERVPQYTWGFVGHVSYDFNEGRNRLMDVMMNEFEDWAWGAGVYFEDAARLYQKSRVVLNKSLRGDLNMRTFEAMGTRTMLMTDKMEGMDELGLKDGEHYIGYDSIGECVEKMGYWLDPARDEKRREIAWNGWRWFLSGHTMFHRTVEFLKRFGVDLKHEKV